MSPLPIPFPSPADRVRRRCRSGQGEQLAVVVAAMILAPGHLASVGVEVCATDLVVLADLGPAQAGEVALRHVGADAFIHERNRVIDAAGREAGGDRNGGDRAERAQ